MQRPMRKKARQASDEKVIKILENSTNGVLAVSGDDDYPYAVPLSYVYIDGKIYFHSTNQASHKLDAIKRNEKVSFCVVSQDDIIAEEFTTNYASVIAFGKARILEDENEAYQAMMSITRKYSPDFMKAGHETYKQYINALSVIELQIEHITGKIRAKNP